MFDVVGSNYSLPEVAHKFVFATCFSNRDVFYLCLGGCVVKVLTGRVADRNLKTACGFQWLLIMLMMLNPTKGECAEFSLFKLTGIEGAMKLGYSLRETDLDQPDGTSTYEKRPSTEQELTLVTSSYVFHPNLLEMELGGGVRFEQDSLENNTGAIDTKGTYYNFSGRWKFLKSKPYSFNLYFTQQNPTKAVGLAGALAIETKSYGMGVLLRQPLISTPITLNVDHIQSYGESSYSIIDDTTDSVSLGIRKNIGDYGNARLGFSSVEQKSASGSLNLPLQASESNTDSMDWNSRLVFGDKRNITLTNYLLLTRNEQSNALNRDQANFYNHLTWDINDTLQTYNTYNYSNTRYGDDDTTNQSIVLGSTNNISDAWSINTFIDTTNEKNVGFEKTTNGLSGSFIYRGDLNDRWSASAAYTALLRLHSQESDISSITVLDESHVLNGLTSVLLDEEFVLPGSVMVSNITHTQTYVENVDYQLTVVGDEIRIERLATGNIADGETVLIDYVYEAGGTYDYKEIGQSLSIIYSLDRLYNFSMFYSNNKQSLQSGISVRPLSSVEKYRFGADALLPITKSMEYGWKLEFERRLEEIHPYRRASLDLNFNSSLPFFASVANLSTGYEYIDNELSENDIKESYYTAILSARPDWYGIASLELTHRRDTGGEDFKSSTYAALGYSWRRGKLGISMLGKHTKELQGNTSRTHTLVEVQLTRHFR